VDHLVSALGGVCGGIWSGGFLEGGGAGLARGFADDGVLEHALLLLRLWHLFKRAESIRIDSSQNSKSFLVLFYKKERLSCFGLEL
jgi:hypothetical protein